MAERLGINKQTTVTIGILITMLGATTGGAFAFSSMLSEQQRTNDYLESLRTAVDRNTDARNQFDRALAIVQTVITNQGDRLSAQDKRIAELEKELHNK